MRQSGYECSQILALATELIDPDQSQTMRIEILEIHPDILHVRGDSGDTTMPRIIRP